MHRSPIDRHETRFAIQLTRDYIGQKVYPVHRLDKPTSGVLLFALDSHIASLVAEQFRAGRVQKTYLAVVRGHIPASGVIDHPLKEQQERSAIKASGQDKAAKDAVTHYRRLLQFETPFAVDRYPSSRYSLAEVCPKTGRTHQIRRHMKHISHQMIGDTTHGNGKHNRFFREQFGCQRLLLHAASLQLRHPASDKWLCIHASLPPDFVKVMAQLDAFLL